MEENVYLNTNVFNSKASSMDNRDSGFGADDTYSYMEEEKKKNKKVINSFNVSTTRNKNKRDNVFHLNCLNSNELICIINILASSLGTGVFFFPCIIYQIGVITSLIIFLFVSICVYYSLDLLRRFVVDSKIFSFGIITQTTLGENIFRVYSFSAFLFYMSIIVNYLDVLHNLININEWVKDSWKKIIYFVVSCIIEVVLCLFTSQLSKLYFLSLIAVITFFIVLIVLITKSISTWNSGNFKSLPLFTIEMENKSSPSNWNIFLFIMAKIIEIFYAFINHSSFPTILNGIDNINSTNSKKINNVSYLILVIIYLVFTFFGCSFYKPGSVLILSGDIEISNDILKYSFIVVLILFLLALIPIRFIVIRDNFSSMIGKEELPFTNEILITSLCLIINNAIIYFTLKKKDILSYLIHSFGGLLGVFICFILPVVSHIAINGKTKLRSIFGYIISVVFIIIGIFSIVYNFLQDD